MGHRSKKNDALELALLALLTLAFGYLYKLWRQRKYKKEFFGLSVNDHMQKIDSMDGREFEEFVDRLYMLQGYRTKLTPSSGDQGVDVIAAKDGKKYGIQVKRYFGSVGNAAVQEVIAGMIFHQCDYGIVITNSTFTNSAIQLAQRDGTIELIDRPKLKQLIYESHFKAAKQKQISV